MARILISADGQEVTLSVTPSKREKEAIIHNGENVAEIKELGLSVRDFNDEIRNGSLVGSFHQ